MLASNFASLCFALILTLSGTPQLEGQDAAQPAATPASAETEGRALWDAMVAAAAHESKGPVQAFVLEFEATSYSGEKQSNDVSATYTFLSPRWVRMLLKSGRERLRGPKGDFLIDKSGVQPLVGRDFKQDLVELDDSVTIARTFTHLTDPRGVQVERVTRLAAPPAGLPAKLRTPPAELDWISLWSRDFRGPRAGPQGPADRIDLGLQRGSAIPRLVVLTYATAPGEAPNALALELDEFTALDGFRVPGRITAWRLDTGLQPPGFGERASFDLWLKRGTLAPQLSEADFEPPSKR